jgi:hypothetical protein
MYYTGTGVKVDYSETAKWVQQASEHGYARAQLDLGYLYEQGKGVPLDYVSAYMWYDLATRAGDNHARAQRESLSRRMTREQIAEATARAAQSPVPRLPTATSDTSAIGSPFSERR